MESCFWDALLRHPLVDGSDVYRKSYRHYHEHRSKKKVVAFLIEVVLRNIRSVAHKIFNPTTGVWKRRAKIHKPENRHILAYFFTLLPTVEDQDAMNRKRLEWLATNEYLIENIKTIECIEASPLLIKMTSLVIGCPIVVVETDDVYNVFGESDDPAYRARVITLARQTRGVYAPATVDQKKIQELLRHVV